MIVLVPELAAERSPDDPFADLPARAEASRKAEAPRLSFSLLAEIPLPGPLPGHGPRWIDDRIEIPVADGTAITSLEAGSTPEIRLDPDGLPPPLDPWALDSRGVFRCRSLPGGWILAQRRCSRCAEGWKKVWRLRVPGHAPAPPLVRDRRVYFGAMDNRIYCVKRKNGHRVWTFDVDGRISGPLVPWSGEIAGNGSDEDEREQRELNLILAVPDGGAELLALNQELGQKVAGISVPAGEGYLLNAPLATPDGRVAVAWQKYSETDASLMVYRLNRRAPPPSEGDAGEADSILSAPIFLR